MIENNFGPRQFKIAKGILCAVSEHGLNLEEGYCFTDFPASDYAPDDCTVMDSIEVGKVMVQRGWVEPVQSDNDAAGYVITELGVELLEKIKKMQAANA